MSETNTLAYFAAMSVMVLKKFYQIGTTGVIKLLPVSPILLQNKLMCLSLFAHMLRHSTVLLQNIRLARKTSQGQTH